MSFLKRNWIYLRSNEGILAACPHVYVRDITGLNNKKISKQNYILNILQNSQQIYRQGIKNSFLAELSCIY